jgi:hypothetical protein
MILSRRYHIRLTLLLIVTVLCHFGLNASLYTGIVWCFGADGHIAMEAAGHHHESGSLPADFQAVNNPQLAAADNLPCTDIAPPNADQVCAEFGKDLSKLTWPALGLAILAVCWLLPTLARQVFRFAFPSHARFIDPNRLALRSIVLLI